MDEILDEKTYETREIRYASFAQRTVAFLMDMLLFLLLSYAIYYLFGTATGYPEFIQKYWWQNMLILSFYFIFFDGSEKNATLGKQVMNIRLLNEQKHDIDITTSAKHLLVSVILFFGYFNMLSNDKHQTLADKICKITVIIRK